MNSPNTWKKDILANVADWGSGGTPLSSVSYYYKNGTIKWAIIGDLKDDILYDTQKKITDEGLKNSSAKIVPKGALLVGMYGSVGKTAITGCEMATNQAIAFGVPKADIIDLFFLKYFINFNVSNLFRLSKGGTQKNISQEVLKQIGISYPSIEEQRAIVQEIEKQFTKLDEAMKSLNAVKEKVDTYRLSVLKSVFSGNISWNDNSETKQVNVLGMPIRVCASWKMGTLSDLGEFGRGKSKHRPRDDPALYGGKYPFIQTGEIANAKTKVAAYSKTYSEAGLSQSKLWKKGTLCITIAANIARTAILDFDSCFPDSIVGFTSNNETTAYYVMYYIKYIQSLIESKASATAQKNINLAILSEIPIPILDVNIQSEIVDELEEKFSISEKIEKVVEQSLFKVSILRNSILKEAFEGNLATFEAS
jgi:type I restriction enzyme S subunit